MCVLQLGPHQLKVSVQVKTQKTTQQEKAHENVWSRAGLTQLQKKRDVILDYLLRQINARAVISIISLYKFIIADCAQVIKSILYFT